VVGLAEVREPLAGRLASLGNSIVKSALRQFEVWVATSSKIRGFQADLTADFGVTRLELISDY